MFETVAPEAFQTRSQRIFIKTLPVSIAVHLAAIATVMAARVWSVDFPQQSPKVSVAYSLTQVPDPPPPPPPPPKPVELKPQPLHSAPAPPPLAPIQIVAPTIIPDVIPEVLPPQPAPPPPPVAEPVKVAANASPNGVAGGKPGGTGRALGGEGITLGDDGKVYVDRKVKVPMKEIAHEYPHYPDAAKKAKLEGGCIVRYTVGKNGRVTDITFLKNSEYPMFDEETIKTVQGWRYQPMTVDGKPDEVIHEIEVNYEFTVR
jgi:protein TonB